MASQDWQKASHIVQAARARPPQARDKFIAEACAGNELLQQEVEIMLRYYSAADSAQAAGQALQPTQAKPDSGPLEQWWPPPRKSGKLSQPAHVKQPADKFDNAAEQAKPVEQDLHRRPTDALPLPPLAEPAARDTAPLVAGSWTDKLFNELSSGNEQLKSERQTGNLPPLITQSSGAAASPSGQSPGNSGQSVAQPPPRPSFDQASHRPVFQQPPQRANLAQPTYSPLFSQQPEPPPPKPEPPPRPSAGFDQASFRANFGFAQTGGLPRAGTGQTGPLRSPETRQLDGRLLAHYQLQYELGRGGMGRVYLAQDTRLGRRVALKLLLRHSTRDPERVRRFQQEARAASGLNHPNILTIHEIGEHKGVQYLATEYVEGRTLRSLLDRGRFKPGIAINIALQIASALETAHRANIVHRDIKPENLMLRPDGYIKVLDFGIAKLSETEGEAAPVATGATGQFETKPGVVVGTVNYMSPEQARGLRVDRRTDVFSLGIVLYEMITGHCPFSGPTQSDVLAALLARDPAPLALQSLTAPLNVLQSLQLILHRTLEKDRNLRYQSARELAADLKALKKELEAGPQMRAPHSKETVINNAATAVAASEPDFGETEEVAVQPSGETTARPSTGQKRATTDKSAAAAKAEAAPATELWQQLRSKSAPRWDYAFLALLGLLALYGAYHYSQFDAQVESIAVLPFEYAKASRLDEAEREYLADGLTESLIQRLSQAAGLKVIARNSVFRYKGKAPDPREVGHALNVRTVLNGRLTQRGENLAVGVELVDTRTSTVLWSQQFESKTSELPALQRDIAKRIATQLRLQLTGAEQQRLDSRDTENAEAYKLYLKGRHLWNQRTGEALKKSIETFQRAVLLDPNYARAYAALADSYALAPIYSDLAPEEAVAAGKDATVRALQLDPKLAEPHAALGFMRFQYEWNWQGAEQSYQRALELNDNYATAHHWYSSFLASLGRFREALTEAERACELDPVSTSISTNLGAVLYYARRPDEAIQQFQKALELNPNAAGAHAHLGLAYEQKRDHGKALAEFQRASELAKSSTPMRLRLARALALAGKQEEARRLLDELQQNAPPGAAPLYLVAAIYTALGEKEQALALLMQAVSLREEGITLLKVDPQFDALRSDPRFNKLLKSVGFVK